jgi:hypothetical protein
LSWFGRENCFFSGFATYEALFAFHKPSGQPHIAPDMVCFPPFGSQFPPF